MTEAQAVPLSEPPPKKKPKRRRARHVFVRLDDAELAALETLSRVAGLSVGAYFRKAALGDAGPRAKRAAPTAESRLRFDHVTAINRAGNLVNQGIRALNEVAQAAPAADHRDRLAYEIETTRKLLQSAIPALDLALAAVVAE